MATAPTHYMNPDEMRELLATLLAGAACGSKATWRKLVGVVQRIETWRLVRTNWLVEPSGTAEQRDAIERAVEVVRAEHPYLD